MNIKFLYIIIDDYMLSYGFVDIELQAVQDLASLYCLVVLESRWLVFRQLAALKRVVSA